MSTIPRFLLQTVLISNFLTSSGASHRFDHVEADWGFTRFTSLRDIVRKLPNHSRPIMENDEVVITCVLRVFNDVTGVLWHNFAK